MKARSEGHFTTGDIPRCAGEQYPLLVLGENDLTVFERSLPWDHAAGAIFLNEAGGKLCRKDGSPYVVGDDRRGLLGAVSPQLWDEAARILFGYVAPYNLLCRACLPMDRCRSLSFSQSPAARALNCNLGRR